MSNQETRGFGVVFRYKPVAPGVFAFCVSQKCEALRIEQGMDALLIGANDWVVGMPGTMIEDIDWIEVVRGRPLA